MDVADFTIAIPEADLDDLRRRLAAARWPRAWPERPWAAGTDEATLRRLVARWGSGFDWRAHEATLNELPQRSAMIMGLRIHFVHFRAGHGAGLPVILTNGWPSTRSLR